VDWGGLVLPVDEQGGTSLDLGPLIPASAPAEVREYRYILGVPELTEERVGDRTLRRATFRLTVTRE